MDYFSKFDFDKEFKENFNSENDQKMTIDTYINSKHNCQDEIDQNNKTSSMVNVRFSQLNEMTGMLGKFKHNMEAVSEFRKSDCMSNKKLVKCYYNQVISKPNVSYISQASAIKNFLTLYTIGGFRYFASINLPILAVFPLEDGLIAKCVYDK